MKLSAKTLAIVLLFVGLVLVNYLASSIPVRADLTAESIYTLSPGTKAILKKIEEPITLDFYFSKSAKGLPIAYKNYGDRVKEMLRQYARLGRGKVRLNVIDPRPDTPEEEKATAAGLSGVPLGNGEKFYFGLVVTLADQQKVIPTFLSDDNRDPFGRERYLEYDVSKAIYSVQLIDKPKLGLLTSLPLQGSSQQEMQMMMMMHQRPTQGQFIIDELKESFDIVKVEPTASELPNNLDELAVIHPENLSPKLQFAIDQFLLAGKPVFLCVDPSSDYFKRQGGQQAQFGGQSPNVSSDLPVLFNAYGIAYDPQKVVCDLDNGAPMRGADGNVVNHPNDLFLHAANFNDKSLTTAQLSKMLFIDAGSVSLKEGSQLKLTPLIETSANSGDLQPMMLQFAQPDDIARQVTRSGKKIIAALITGKFTTAFPNGTPADEKAKDEKTADKNKPPAPKPSAPALKESTKTSTLLVVTDSDWLFDDYSVRKFNFFGQTVAQPLDDNLAFAANSVDFLGGSDDLISIRSKGRSVRQFDVIHRMEVAAQDKYQEKLNSLEADLKNVQAKLSELQGKKTEGNRLVASPEIAKSIEEYQKRSAKLQSERREIRLALRENIDRLENRLTIVNLLASPLLVIGFGLWFQRSRKK